MVVQSALMILVLIAGPCVGSWQLGTLTTRIAAAVLLVVGAGFGLGGVRDLGAARTSLPKPLPGAPLVQSGIYAWVRHPLYASLIWLGVGWALLFMSIPALAFAIAQWVFLDLKARREERWLRETFPGYAGYAVRVKRFIPHVY